MGVLCSIHRKRPSTIRYSPGGSLMRQKTPYSRMLYSLHSVSGYSVTVSLTQPVHSFANYLEPANFASRIASEVFIPVSKQPQVLITILSTAPATGVQSGESINGVWGYGDWTGGECSGRGRSTRTRIYCFVALSFTLSTSSRRPRMCLI
jgi:hypothetical protein